MAKIRFYFDEMMPRRVAEQLIAINIDVLMAVDVEMAEKDDLTEHLPFASERGLMLVTLDRSFAGRAMQLTNHAGIICWTGEATDFGGMIRALSNFVSQNDFEEVTGQVFWLRT
jgi:predicted nuclease of predicted toxin-antitoxin system